MAAKQKITVTRTRTRTRVRKSSGTKGGRKRCPTCGKYY